MFGFGGVHNQNLGEHQKREQKCTRGLEGKTGRIDAVTDIPGKSVSAERAWRSADFAGKATGEPR